MENKETFFQACDRMLANENFNWGSFYKRTEVNSITPNTCGTTGCLMHEYPKISAKFKYEDLSVVFRERRNGEARYGDGAFAAYHNVNQHVASIIICQDFASFMKIRDDYGLFTHPSHGYVYGIMSSQMSEVSANEALFLCLFFLINTEELKEDEVPEHLLKIYHSIPNGK